MPIGQTRDSIWYVDDAEAARATAETSLQLLTATAAVAGASRHSTGTIAIISNRVISGVDHSSLPVSASRSAWRVDSPQRSLRARH